MIRRSLGLAILAAGCTSGDAIDPALPGPGSPTDPTGLPDPDAALFARRFDADDGRNHALADAAGRVLVLEWFAPDCPFVVAAHAPEGPLRTLPARLVRDDLWWWGVNSAAPGHTGYHWPRERREADLAIGYPILHDEGADLARAFGVEATPHVVIIGRDGRVAYSGGIDDAPLLERVPTVRPVEDAISSLQRQESPPRSRFPTYGCALDR